MPRFGNLFVTACMVQVSIKNTALEDLNAATEGLNETLEDL